MTTRPLPLRSGSAWRLRNDPAAAAAGPAPRPESRPCAHPGCAQPGEYRAPKSRVALTDYYWFCLEHVRDYNRKWDYYAGMSPTEIEAQIRGDTTWQRPTWPMGEWRLREAMLRREAHGSSPFGRAGAGGNGGSGSSGERVEDPARTGSRPRTPEEEALADLGLTPPVAFAEIKVRYRELAKRHHPDANGGDPAAEEKLKQINRAYTILKAAWLGLS